MPYIKVYIHFVWSTKNRYPYLSTKSLRKYVWKHIRNNAFKNKIFIDFINGYSDHCHCLVSLNSSQSLQYVMQMIKGESSFWINQNALTNEKFDWQDEYYAASVSEADLNYVREYIKNQEIHHENSSFQFEQELLTKKFEKFKD